MVGIQPKMDTIRDSYDAFCGLCDPNLLETLRERVEDLSQEWQRIEERLKNKITNLKVAIPIYAFTLSLSFVNPFSRNRLYININGAVR